MNMYFPSTRQISTYEHVFPLSKTCGISLEHQASGILEKYFLLEYSLPLEISFSPWGGDTFSLWCDLLSDKKLWCDLSLPLWHQFPRRALLDMWYKWVGPRVTEQSSMSNMMLVEDKNHWVELEQTEIRNKWHVGFPVMESVTSSCVLRLHRKISVGPKRTNRCDRVHQSETTCHLSSLDK